MISAKSAVNSAPKSAESLAMNSAKGSTMNSAKGAAMNSALNSAGCSAVNSAKASAMNSGDPPLPDKYEQYCRKCWPHTLPPVPEVSEDGSASSASIRSSSA